MKFVQSSARFAVPLVTLACLWAMPLPAAVMVSIVQRFDGISYGGSNTNSAALPPDCNGAVGPNHFVEFINGVFAVYDKSSGTQMEFKTDVDFWASARVGIDVAGGADVSDPRIIYDPASQRWFASQIDINYQIDWNTFTVTLGTNDFLLAVSVTADPTGEWRGASFPSDPEGVYFADFPTLGVDSQGVYLAGDMYDANDDPLDPTAPDLGCALVSLPKADLLASPPVFSNRTWFGVMSFSERGQIFQPATCNDGSGVGKILAAGNIGTDSSPHSNLVTFSVQNLTAPRAATLSTSSFITVTPYMVPDNAAAGYPLLTARQPDGTTTLQANDARFSARAYTVGGVLYGVHNTELNGRIAIRWYRINAAGGSLLESGTIADPNLDLFYPSIAANTNGVVVIGYNASGLGTNHYISCYAIVGQTANGVTTFGSPVLLQPGLTSYHGDDEGVVGPTSRWGDYSATCVDPSDPNRFWTVQMYPSDVDVWTTQISELLTTPLQLNIARAGANVTISWPSVLTGYQLQSTASLAAPVDWSDVTQTTVTNGAQVSVTLPMAAGPRLFHLQKK